MIHYLARSSSGGGIGGDGGDGFHRDGVLQRGVRQMQRRGYDVRLMRRFDLAAALSAVAPTARHNVSSWADGPFWRYHASDFARYVLLWEYGGVYCDTDVMLVRALPPSLLPNFVAFQEAQRTRINGAVMGFAPRHALLRTLLLAALDEYATKNGRASYIAVGPRLLTRVVRSQTWVGLKTLPSRAFQPLPYKKVGPFCFEQPLRSTRHANRTALAADTYALHLNTKLTIRYAEVPAGTLCHSIYSTFCVLCATDAGA